jgi:predicted ester cyclase
MTRDELLKIYRTHLDAEQAHDATSAAATYVDHGYYRVMPLGMTFEGRQAVAAQYAMSYVTFPDARFEIADEVVKGTVLFHSGVMHGTADGPFLGHPPTGRRVALPFSARIEFAEGAMLGETLWYDLGTLCDQIGVPYDAARAASAQLAAQLQSTGTTGGAQ